MTDGMETGRLTMENRNEDLVELNTNLGQLTIEGRDLRLKCLSLDTGTLVVEGELCGLRYAEPGRKRGFRL